MDFMNSFVCFLFHNVHGVLSVGMCYLELCMQISCSVNFFSHGFVTALFGCGKRDQHVETNELPIHVVLLFHLLVNLADSTQECPVHDKLLQSSQAKAGSCSSCTPTVLQQVWRSLNSSQSVQSIWHTSAQAALCLVSGAFCQCAGTAKS